MNGNKSLYPIWLGVLGIALLAGAVAGVFIFMQGHVLFNANDVLIWTLPLGVYIFLALSSSGLTLLSALPLVFGIKKYEPFAKRLVFLAIATLCGGFRVHRAGARLHFPHDLHHALAQPVVADLVDGRHLQRRAGGPGAQVLEDAHGRLPQQPQQAAGHGLLRAGPDRAPDDRLGVRADRVAGHLFRPGDVHLLPADGGSQRHGAVHPLQSWWWAALPAVRPPASMPRWCTTISR
ncbi:MAG: hypothetical protein MZV70_33285 [Desulfobacterales bacterium]|nr:hypothetical protein [Desulfobacterales bacterium]